MKPDKRTTQLARQFLKLSLGADGQPSPERVAAVLAYIEKTKPARALALLQSYRRLLAVETARGQALIEHAGPINETIIAQIAAAMTAKYHRPIAPAPKPNPALLAGLRVRVGDDLYDASALGTLNQFATATEG